MSQNPPKSVSGFSDNWVEMKKDLRPLAESEKFKHIPVMRSEVLASLKINPNGLYWDGTFGRGGHALAILDSLSNEKGLLLTSDQDKQASYSAARYESHPKFCFLKARFSQALSLFNSMGKCSENGLDGILLDLGVSSPQLDEACRGFSFLKAGPLDMRMDQEQGISASEWLASVSQEELEWVLSSFGEEPFARRISEAFVSARIRKPITQTLELAEIVSSCVPRRGKRHPATKTFQAIRMRVNQELNELHLALEEAARFLRPGGRLVLLTFQGLESRIIKRVLSKIESIRFVTKAAPSRAEILENPRARSAWMRVFEKR